MTVLRVYPIAAVATVFGLLPMILALNFSTERVTSAPAIVLAFVVSSVVFSVALRLMRDKHKGAVAVIVAGPPATLFLCIGLSVGLSLG